MKHSDMLGSQFHQSDSAQHRQDVDAPQLLISAPSRGPDARLDAGQPGPPEARQGRLLGWHGHPVLGRPQGRRQLPMHGLTSWAVERATPTLPRDTRLPTAVLATPDRSFCVCPSSHVSTTLGGEAAWQVDTALLPEPSPQPSGMPPGNLRRCPLASGHSSRCPSWLRARSRAKNPSYSTSCGRYAQVPVPGSRRESSFHRHGSVKGPSRGRHCDRQRLSYREPPTRSRCGEGS